MIEPVRNLKVGIDFGDGAVPVGVLALDGGGIYFQYDGEFVGRELDISPPYLPLRTGIFPPDPDCPREFGMGLPGVFYDSLPDSWGRLVLRRHLEDQGINPAMLSPLDRLAYVGANAMGALVYEPDRSVHAGDGEATLDRLAEESDTILRGEPSELMGEFAAGLGGSGGAQPKTLIAVNGQRDHCIHSVRDMPAGYTPWMVKFPNTESGPDAGAVEYVYARMAADAGVDMTDAHLFEARQGCAGYFATRLFDRDGGRRHHIHSACGLLYSSFENPALDAEHLVRLAMTLSDDIREVERLFRNLAFNVFAHNRDDHSKNFSFLMDSGGRWRTAPAYDLTFNHGPNGYHKTSVLGESRNPGNRHLAKLGEFASLDSGLVGEILERTKDSVSRWPSLAKEFGVSSRKTKEVWGLIGPILAS